MPVYFLEILVVALGLILLMVEAFLPPTVPKRYIARIGIAGLGVVFVLLFFTSGKPGGSEHVFWTVYSAARPALFFKGFALLTTMIILVIAMEYTTVIRRYLGTEERVGAGLGEFFCIPIFVCAGLMWMASATDLITIFVSLELVTISFYVLVSFMRRNVGSLEAGTKYLILGALSTGFLVYGLAWLFGVTGSSNLAVIGERLSSLPSGTEQAALFAFALVFVGLAFKVAAVPLQIWVPDVYQGAPTPVTAFLSVGSKAAGFVVLARVLEPFLASEALRDSVVFTLLLVAGATLIYGNLAAIPQRNFKRLLAYSSIAHAGFLLLALACVDGARFSLSPAAVVAFYLAAYLLMTLLAFVVLTLVRSQLGADNIDAFDGLHRRSPFLAFALLVSMVSLAGVPLTAGFIGKFFVFNLAVDGGHYVLVLLAVIGVAAGFYYYLKVVRAMYWNDPIDDGEIQTISISRLTRGVIVLLIGAIFVFGVYPKPILALFGAA